MEASWCDSIFLQVWLTPEEGIFFLELLFLAKKCHIRYKNFFRNFFFLIIFWSGCLVTKLDVHFTSIYSRVTRLFYSSSVYIMYFRIRQWKSLEEYRKCVWIKKKTRCRKKILGQWWCCQWVWKWLIFVAVKYRTLLFEQMET